MASMTRRSGGLPRSNTAADASSGSLADSTFSPKNGRANRKAKESAGSSPSAGYSTPSTTCVCNASDFPTVGLMGELAVGAKYRSELAAPNVQKNKISGLLAVLPVVTAIASFVLTFWYYTEMVYLTRGLQQVSTLNNIYNEYYSSKTEAAMELLEEFAEQRGQDQYAHVFLKLRSTGAAEGKELERACKQLVQCYSRVQFFYEFGHVKRSYIERFPGRERAVHFVRVVEPLDFVNSEISGRPRSTVFSFLKKIYALPEHPIDSVLVEKVNSVKTDLANYTQRSPEATATAGSLGQCAAHGNDAHISCSVGAGGGSTGVLFGGDGIVNGRDVVRKKGDGMRWVGEDAPYKEAEKKAYVENYAVVAGEAAAGGDAAASDKVLQRLAERTETSESLEKTEAEVLAALLRQIQQQRSRAEGDTGSASDDNRRAEVL